MSHRAIAMVLVVVGFVTALVVSTRLNPTYQSTALVSLGVVADSGRDSLEEQLALSRDDTARKVIHGNYGPGVTARVRVAEEGALEFVARDRDPRRAAAVANAYATAYVDLRMEQLQSPHRKGVGLELERPVYVPTTAGEPQVVTPAVPARAPLPPWPTETWTLAGMVLIALALAVPGPEPGPSGNR